MIVEMQLGLKFVLVSLQSIIRIYYIVMTHIEEIRHSIIDKILSIKSAELLSAYDKILTVNNHEPLSLTEEQIEMLKMSDADIENGDLISQSEIDKMDAEWLN